MEEKLTTLTITESEIKMLYRACVCRSIYFREKAREAKDPEMVGIDQSVATRYMELGKAIRNQSGVKM